MTVCSLTTRWLAISILDSPWAISRRISVSLEASRAELPACPQELPGCDLPIIDRIRLSLSGTFLGQSLAVVPATLVVADEYTTGLMGTTLLATPRRLAVVAAKAATAVGVVALAATAAVVASFAVAAELLPGRGFTAANGYPPVAPTDPAVLRAGGGTVLYLCLVALIAVGTAFAVRETTASLAVVLSLLYLVPLLGLVIHHPTLAELIAKYAPMPAGTAIQVTIAVEALPIGGWAGQAVLACWSACALIAGCVAFVARDA